MLFVLQQTDIGWASQINRKLEEYGLETSWNKIIKESRPKWKNAVLTATEKRNKEILIDMCYSKKGEKTKTRYVLEKLKSDSYERKPLSSFINRNKRSKGCSPGFLPKITNTVMEVKTVDSVIWLTTKATVSMIV